MVKENIIYIFHFVFYFFHLNLFTNMNNEIFYTQIKINNFIRFFLFKNS
jgi:hypothetical protein